VISEVLALRKSTLVKV